MPLKGVFSIIQTMSAILQWELHIIKRMFCQH